QVRRVVQKLRQDGLFETLRQVRTKLDEPMKMGYSSAGMVIGCGQGVNQYQIGDRVASNGPHAGVVSVPVNLCARVPDNVAFDDAAYAVIASIAMQGVRLSRADLGATVFVIGLGLVGQLTMMLLKAAGCRVVGTDPDSSKCELARQLGAIDARPNVGAGDVLDHTHGHGADAVIITASTESNVPIETAADAVRKRGRVVLVGVVRLDLPRRPFYFKEAEFVVSCSYGAGRYDYQYEEQGIDYPVGYARWTEQRNIQAALDLMGRDQLPVSKLTTHRFAIEQADRAYAVIHENAEPYLGIVLQYPDVESHEPRRRIELRGGGKPAGRIGLGCLGAGNFARMTLLPAVQSANQYHLRVICSAGGLSAGSSGEKLGFDAVATDEQQVFADDHVDAVFALTRHDQHARQVIEAIRAGKHVFVEKPLALTIDEVAKVEDSLASAGEAAPMLMVGFNRRFSPAAQLVRKHFVRVNQPLTVTFRFNAGDIPADTWIQNEREGGGRIIGEACHAIDLATYLVGSVPVRVYADCIGGPDAPDITDDQAFITLHHANGSVSSVGYLAGGDRGMPKERVEVLGGGRMAVIDDFRAVQLASDGQVKTHKATGKGHAEEVAAFADAIRTGGRAPIAWEELKAVSLASILAVRSMREGVPLPLTMG
ncbi:MAG: bi-domain-containing oxidoreductase, partial [Phycisphaerae bacterium]|nr:bi-domain-containing oxidoreductase [Phycisphaerae bacterium]